MSEARFKYDLAISYAGEDQRLASDLASRLEARGLSVFFASARQAALLGESLHDVLTRAFGTETRFVLALISRHYSTKDWARFELDVARNEEDRRGEPFILPLILDEFAVDQLPADKVHFDLRRKELDQVVDAVVEKVLSHRGELTPREIFDRAFREWKIDGAEPGTSRCDLFWRSHDILDLDVDRCEFLLNCGSSSGKRKSEVLHLLDPRILAEAAERLIKTAKNRNFELSAIRYVGVAEPKRAEHHLWRVYESEKLHINDRMRAFEHFWRCPGQRATEEYKKVLVDKSVPWQLRRAAAINVLWADRDADTKRLVSSALGDSRREVRKAALNAVLRFRLECLAPDLMKAHERERSAKGRREIESVLRHFNERSDVVAFGRDKQLGRAFFKPPPFEHDWEARREDWA